MAKDHTFHSTAANPSPPLQPHAGEDDYTVSNTWASVATSSQEQYPMTHGLPWSSLSPSLGIESLPTPTQAMFDQAFPVSSSYDMAPWTTSALAILSPGPYPTYAAQETAGSSCYPSAARLAASATWIPVDDASTHHMVSTTYDSPPSRSDYSTSSQQSLVESSPYAHSDGGFQLDSPPSIKVEDATEYQRPRLYSVPGLVSFAPPSHVNPEELHSIHPPSMAEQHSANTFQAPTKVESEDSKHILLNQQRPQARRAVSEEPFNALEHRQKRGYTTEANSTCHCKQCGKLFQRSYNLKAHMETHDPNRHQPHACPYPGCRRAFVRRTDLARHEQSVHLKERKFQCPLCYNAFARKDTLRRHVEDGCSRRAEVKKRRDTIQYAGDFSPSSGRSNSEHFDPYSLPGKQEQYS